MELKFNAEARKKRSEELFNVIMKEIQVQLNRGIKTFSFNIDHEFTTEIKELINNEIKDKPFKWSIEGGGYVGREFHQLQYTGE